MGKFNIETFIFKTLPQWWAVWSRQFSHNTLAFGNEKRAEFNSTSWTTLTPVRYFNHTSSLTRYHCLGNWITQHDLIIYASEFSTEEDNLLDICVMEAAIFLLTIVEVLSFAAFVNRGAGSNLERAERVVVEVEGGRRREWGAVSGWLEGGEGRAAEERWIGREEEERFRKDCERELAVLELVGTVGGGTEGRHCIGATCTTKSQNEDII